MSAVVPSQANAAADGPRPAGAPPNPRLAAVCMIVRRSLRRHALSTAVTASAVALACGLVIAVFSIQAQTRAAFVDADVGFDAVLGARGSQLQLVLNAVYHLETSPGNIPWSLYQSVKNDPQVALAVPYAVGDSYHGFRVVGTTPEFFTQVKYKDGRAIGVQPPGRVFDPLRREAVVGATVARQTGLDRGATFHPAHGLEEEEHEHEEEYVVVGVLAPTGTPNDRVIWIPIDGVFRMGGHVLRGSGEMFHPRPGQAIPEEHKEVSAVLLRFSDRQAGFDLGERINRAEKQATLAFPIAVVMLDLFEKMGWVSRVLQLVAYLVVAVSALAVLAALYNTINERRREFAILRALGARRATLFSAIVLESATIAGAGTLIGLAVYGGILAVAAWVIRMQTGVILEVFFFHPAMIAAPAGLTALGALAGVIPAVNAYRTDVAENLSPHS